MNNSIFFLNGCVAIQQTWLKIENFPDIPPKMNSFSSELCFKIKEQNESKRKMCWLFLSLNNKQYAHSFNCQSSVSRAQASHTLIHIHSHMHVHTLYRCECYVKCNQLLQSTINGKGVEAIERKNQQQNCTQFATLDQRFFVSRIENKIVVFFFLHSFILFSTNQSNRFIFSFSRTHAHTCRFLAKKSLPFGLKNNLLAVQFSRKYFFFVNMCEIAIVSNIIFASVWLPIQFVALRKKKKQNDTPTENTKWTKERTNKWKKKEKITHRNIETDSSYYFSRFYSHLCWCNCNIFIYIRLILFFFLIRLSFVYTQKKNLLLLLLYTLWDDNYFSVKFIFFHLKNFYWILSNGGETIEMLRSKTSKKNVFSFSIYIFHAKHNDLLVLCLSSAPLLWLKM